MAEPDRPILPHEEPLPPRVDLRIAAFLLLLGLAILGLALQMPTGLDQKGQIYTAPGLVPGIYGIVIAGLSIWLGVRALRRRASGAVSDASADSTAQADATSNLRLALCAILCVAFAVGLIGRLPFWVAAAIFVTLFIVLFEWEPDAAPRARAWAVGTALAQGIATGLIVALVFEKLFLVRLP